MMTARQRTRNEFATLDSTYQVGTGTPQVWTTVNYSTNEVMDDVVTPNFAAKMHAGEIVNNPVLYVKESIKNSGVGHLKWTRGAAGNIYESKGNVTAMNILRIPGYVAGVAPVPVIPFDCVGDAKLTALSHLDRTPYAFGEDIGELLETIRFVKDPLHSIRRLGNSFSIDVKQLLKRKRKGINPYYNLAEAVADVWKQYRFAASPLVRSVHDALMSTLESQKPPKRRTARGFSENTQVNKTTKYASGHFSRAQTTNDLKARAGILYEVTNPVNDWRYKYGLRFKDTPATLWQLFPYSFMVDRMFNISQTLGGLASFLDPEVKILTSWVSQKSEITKSRSYEYYDGAIVGSIQVKNKDSYIVTTFTYRRDPWEIVAGDFVPGFYPRGLVNSLTKVVDLAAISLRLFKPS